MSRTVLPTCAAAAVLLVLVGGTPVAPTTAPAISASTASASTARPAPRPLHPAIRRAYAQLADADPAVRDRAREELMGLSRRTLPLLLDVVRAAPPARPDQAAALREVVCQAWLAGEPYDAVGGPNDNNPNHTERKYVMGVRWPLVMTDKPRYGVPIIERWPGFPAYRRLRDGDMILGVYVHKDQPLDQPPNRPTHSPQDLHNAVEAAGESRDIDLSVLRDGRTVRVPITLVPQPVKASDTFPPSVADEFVEGRQRAADAYWQQTFAPVVGAAADPTDDTPDPVPAAAATAR